MTTAESLSDDRTRGFIGEVQASRYAGINLDAFEAPAIAVGWVKDGAVVLDVGCGEGGLAAHLQTSKACQVTGLEPNAHRAAAAAALGVKVHRCYLAADFCASAGKFDTVLFMDVLEHVADPLELLMLARTVLSRNGTILVSVPNVAHWTVRVKLMAGKWNYQPTGIMDATHLRWFTRKTARELARAAGLDVLEQTVSRGTWMSVYALHVPWRWLSKRSLQWLLGHLCHFFPGLFGCQHLLRLSPGQEDACKAA